MYFNCLSALYRWKLQNNYTSVMEKNLTIKISTRIKCQRAVYQVTRARLLCHAFAYIRFSSSPPPAQRSVRATRYAARSVHFSVGICYSRSLSLSLFFHSLALFTPCYSRHVPLRRCALRHLPPREHVTMIISSLVRGSKRETLLSSRARQLTSLGHSTDRLRHHRRHDTHFYIYVYIPTN